MEKETDGDQLQIKNGGKTIQTGIMCNATARKVSFSDFLLFWEGSDQTLHNQTLK